MVDSDGFVGFLIQTTATEPAVSNTEFSERETFIDLGHDIMELGIASIADIIYSDTSEAGELAILIEVAVQTRVQLVFSEAEIQEVLVERSIKLAGSVVEAVPSDFDFNQLLGIDLVNWPNMGELGIQGSVGTIQSTAVHKGSFDISNVQRPLTSSDA